MDENIKKYADERHWRIFKRIHKQTCLDATDLQEYLNVLQELQNTKTFLYMPFFKMCMKEMEMVQKKSSSQTYAESFSGITYVFGRSLLEIKFTSEMYSEIIEIWSNLLPKKKEALHKAFLENEAIFQKLFNQLPTLGNVIMQWDLIGILLKYTLHSSLSRDTLLKLTKGPEYSRVRKSFKKISSEIDHHSLDILKKIHEDCAEKLVVSLTAIEGYYNGYRKINAIQFAGVSQALVVYFNIGRPGISCLFDISTLKANDRSEEIYVLDISIENIRKITLNKRPNEEIYVIKIKFKSTDLNGIKKLGFTFRSSQLEQMINSNVFTVLQIKRNDLKSNSANNIHFNSSIANSNEQNLWGRRTCTDYADMNVSDTNIGSPLENSAETANATYTVIYISDSELSQNDQSTIVEQKVKNSGSTLLEGIQPLTTETNSQFSFEIILDSQLDNTDIWNSNVSIQSSREINKNAILHSQRDIDSVATTQNSRTTDVNSVLSLNGSQPTETNSKQISLSPVTLQLNVPSSSSAIQPAVSHKSNEDSKPTRRKLFDLKRYNESQEMSTSKQSIQINEKRGRAPIDPKTVFHLTDDPYRILDFNYSSDDLGKNLRSKRRPVKNATRFKAIRAPASKHSHPPAENSTAVSNGSSLAKYPKLAAITNLLPQTHRSAEGCKKPRLYEEMTNISSNRTCNKEDKLATKRSKTSMQNSGESVNKKAKLMKPTQEPVPSQADDIQMLDHSESVLPSRGVSNWPHPQSKKIEEEFISIILLEIEKLKQLMENEEITPGFIDELILKEYSFVKEISKMLTQVSNLHAKNKKHIEKVIQCGIKASVAHAEQLKKFEQLKLNSANFIRTT